MKTKPIQVLFADDVPDSAEKAFKEANFEVTRLPADTENDALVDMKELGEAQVLCVGGNDSPFLTEDVLRSAQRLLAIACFSRNIDDSILRICNEMGIAVFDSPYGESHSVTELILCQILMLARSLGLRNREMHQGVWRKVSDGCHEIRGKTLGIVGYGHVGSGLGIVAESFGMRVIWYDLHSLMPIGSSEPYPSLESVLRESDFVTLCIGDAPENANMLTARHLALMRRGSFLINSRAGNAVDLTAVAESLRKGHLAGAAIDVLPSDVSADQAAKLFEGCPNVLLTRGLVCSSSTVALVRCGWLILADVGPRTVDARDRVGSDVALNVSRFVLEGCSTGSINFPAIGTRPPKVNSRRIINIHKNVRGVVREIDNILSEFNIQKQVIETNGEIGYIVIDVETTEVTSEIVAALALLANTIRTRII